jgi:hypothetical protein
LTRELDDATNLQIAKSHKELSDLLIEPQIKLQSSLFDKARAYTNVILAIGYVGYFGVWSASRPFLSKRQTIWTLVLLLVSLTTFVLYEVLTMFVASRAMRKRSLELFSVPVNDLDVPEILGRFASIDAAANRSMLKLAPLWPFVYVVAVGSGLLGIGTMLSGLFWHLGHD